MVPSKKMRSIFELQCMYREAIASNSIEGIVLTEEEKHKLWLELIDKNMRGEL